LDEVIWPSDVKVIRKDKSGNLQVEGYIVDDELKRFLVDILPEGVQLTALLDCCHSGTGLDLPNSRSFSVSGDGTPIPRSDSPITMSPIDDDVSLLEKILKSSSPERPAPRPIQHKPKRATTKRQSNNALNMPFYALGRQSTEESPKGTIETKTRKNSMPPRNFCNHVTSWSACLDDQIGIECPDGGLLTLAFIRALRTESKVTHEELLNALTRELFDVSIIANMPCPVPSLGSLRPVDGSRADMHY